MSMTPPMMAGDLFARFMAEHPEVTIEWRQLGYPTLDARAWLSDSDVGADLVRPERARRWPARRSARARWSWPWPRAIRWPHRTELTVGEVLDETFPGIVDWCDPVWLGYWGLDGYRGAPARRTDDGAITPEEVASIVASGRAITTVPELVAVPFAPPRDQGDPADRRRAGRADARLARGGATPLVADLVETARLMSEIDTFRASRRSAREKNPLTGR